MALHPEGAERQREGPAQQQHVHGANVSLCGAAREPPNVKVQLVGRGSHDHDK